MRSFVFNAPIFKKTPSIILLQHSAQHPWFRVHFLPSFNLGIFIIDSFSRFDIKDKPREILPKPSNCKWPIKLNNILQTTSFTIVVFLLNKTPWNILGHQIIQQLLSFSKYGAQSTKQPRHKHFHRYTKVSKSLPLVIGENDARKEGKAGVKSRKQLVYSRSCGVYSFDWSGWACNELWRTSMYSNNHELFCVKVDFFWLLWDLFFFYDFRYKACL